MKTVLIALLTLPVIANAQEVFHKGDKVPDYVYRVEGGKSDKPYTVDKTFNMDVLVERTPSRTTVYCMESVEPGIPCFEIVFGPDGVTVKGPKVVGFPTTLNANGDVPPSKVKLFKKLSAR